jgi:hypothetical protein
MLRSTLVSTRFRRLLLQMIQRECLSLNGFNLTFLCAWSRTPILLRSRTSAVNYPTGGDRARLPGLRAAVPPDRRVGIHRPHVETPQAFGVQVVKILTEPFGDGQRF